jgi:nucleotide-binding universal stress UspA family protein
MRRILVPTDFSEPSQQAIHYALRLAAAVEGDLLLLHIVEGDPLPRYIVGGTMDMCPPWVDPPGRLLQESRSATIIYHDRCEEARWKLASLLPPGYPERFRPLVSVGKAAEEIVRVAWDERVDLILFGIHDQPRWRHLLWTSVPTQVMRQTSIPVMMLRIVGRCLFAPQRKRAEAWLRDIEQQSWLMENELESRGRGQNHSPVGMEDTETDVPHWR